MNERKPSEVLKYMQLCGNVLTRTTNNHECAYGDEECMDCIDRLKADIQALIDAGDNLIIRRAAPENKPDLSGIDRVIRLYESAIECPCDTYAHLILVALREYKIRHVENKPLTLEQLRQMEGEPVYNVTNTELGSFWALVEEVYTDKAKLITTDTAHILILHLDAVKCGAVKLYARKPEGSDNVY